MSFQEPFATKVKIEFKINLGSFSYAFFLLLLGLLKMFFFFKCAFINQSCFKVQLETG